MDFDYVRAINEFLDANFLNKTLQSLKGGSEVDPKDVVTYKINNTNYLANLYVDPVLRGGKQTMLLDSIFKVPESFSLDNAIANLDIGGARPKTKKPSSKRDKKGDNMCSKKGSSKKKGGSELYDCDYNEVENLGGTQDEHVDESNELAGANKKKPGRKHKKH